MSTNYDAHLPDGERVHLGLCAAGWLFLFHAQPDRFTSFRELAGWLENTPCVIRDEYGRDQDPVEWIRWAAGWGRDREAQGLSQAHRHTGNCWCMVDRENHFRVHGSNWDMFAERYFVDQATDTDWSYGPEESW